MRVPFRKIRNIFSVNLKYDDVFLDEGEYAELRGSISRHGELCKLECILKARLNLVCCRSGENFFRDFEHDMVLFLCDGQYKEKSTNVDILDIIEFFDGHIDLNLLVESEVQMIRLDYNVKEDIDGSP